MNKYQKGHYGSRDDRKPHTEDDNRRLQVRTGVLVGIFAAILLAFAAVLYQTQIVHGKDYLDRAFTSVQQVETVESVRGELLDRYGRVLVSNAVSYHVTLDTSLMGEGRNETLSRLLELCRERGVEWTDSLPVSAGAPWRYTKTDSLFCYQYEDDEGVTQTAATNLGELAEDCGWVEDARRADLTAQELLSAMADTFGLEREGQALTQADRQLLGVLYELYLRRYEVVNTQYTFARDVDIAFISRVKEQGLTGVVIETDTARQYHTDVAPHVLGTTGAITAENWPTYQELGYPMDAVVGRDGVELAFEEYLHGASGRRAVETDDSGKIVTQEWLEEPEPGDNVVLTLDASLQAVTEDYLADFIQGLDDPAGGAAVVMDMTGGVLAMASYPDFDLATYGQDYSQLVSDEAHPLLNRATRGLYAPGSTFKMVSAVAGLASGVITATDQVECTGYYSYYGTTQRCWIAPGRHGLENVTQAITDSCNVFFYDTAGKMGIATLRDYARQFGLGEYTGIELPEEKGQMAGPEAAEEAGYTWYGGEVLSAAIGQSLSLFTPIQLANYVVTLVNGGSHYRAHLLKEVKSSDYSRVVYDYQPELLHSIDIAPGDLKAVLQGMYDLSKTASMARYFDGLPVEVGCKTGTAEVGAGRTATATFTCFAPYDDPEVVIYLVAENGSSGGGLAQVAAGILAQYFSGGDSQSAPARENTLIR